MQWLAVSIVASVLLTVLLNVAIRLWPGAAHHASRRMAEWSARRASDVRPGQVRVVVPWKAMLIASVVVTIALNVLIRVV